MEGVWTFEVKRIIMKWRRGVSRNGGGADCRAAHCYHALNYFPVLFATQIFPCSMRMLPAGDFVSLII